VRLGTVRAGVWLEKGVAGRTGSWRISYVHTRMWPSVHRTTPVVSMVAQGV
jgi:hypothetical protein